MCSDVSESSAKHKVHCQNRSALRKAQIIQLNRAKTTHPVLSNRIMECRGLRRDRDEIKTREHYLLFTCKLSLRSVFFEHSMGPKKLKANNDKMTI